MKDFFIRFFSLFTSLGDRLKGTDLENPDFVDYYIDYFQETSICSNLGWIAILVALVASVLFYYVICNYVFALAKRSVWYIVLLIVGGTTYALSISNIVGEDNDDPEQATGIFYTSHNVTEPRLLDGTADEEAREEIMDTASSFREQFKSSENSAFMDETLPFELSYYSNAYPPS